jgi:uncharacterized protein (DUF1697 family)
MAGRCVALLRGINVGTAKRVAMADLRALVEGLGYADVSTLLNSGNVVFTAGKGKPHAAAPRIQKALEEKLGVRAAVMVLSDRELMEVTRANPLAGIADDPSRLLVGILGDPSEREKLSGILREDWGGEKIALGTSAGAPRAVFMWMPQGVIKSRLNEAVRRALGDAVTARNWTTILKLKELAAAPTAVS